jgi:hypothetical protein
MSSTSTADQPAGDGPAFSEGLGARSRSAWDAVFHVLEFAQYVAGATCVWVTLRTIVPGAIEWWQAAAMGGCSAIVASLWVRRK